MEITKRSGAVETYDGSKIVNAMKKAFGDQGASPSDESLADLLALVEQKMSARGATSVEAIQDQVEEALMEMGYFAEARSYILYRHKRSELRVARRTIVEAVDGPEGLDEYLDKIQKDFDEDDKYSLVALAAKYRSFLKSDMTQSDRTDALVRAAVELTTQESPKWEFIAGRLLAYRFYAQMVADCDARGIFTFYEKVRYLVDQNLYGSYILEHYAKEELDLAETFIVPERDELFTYSGLDLLLSRYVITTRQHVPLESPQEMFLGISLHLAMEEKGDRMRWVRRFYDMLSQLQVTMATPTISNARKPHHQLSSCFIDTVPDSLDGIYRSIDNFAKVSKFGGGMGLYFGKVRATGGTIRGFEGAAGGVVRWIRIVNDTAVAVDQLGMRAGAVAVYLDVWHRDLPEFLQLRTNNGDDRMKAHDVFPAVCYPDLFWRLAKDDIDADWHMMCPHDILTVKGYSLEDYYGEEWERRYQECVDDPRIPKRTMSVKEIV
ncbi:MAG: ribonucleoside-diphosphate reductase subunit alpha, partial [Eggerthellaceae bacterium]|nr:ribonucleoside-diphosphate reductase subunit alpha [Eggerthellaceae bacterium]